jgi:hypothetical protein
LDPVFISAIQLLDSSIGAVLRGPYLYPHLNSFVVSFVVHSVAMDPLTCGFSSMSPVLDHDLSLHLTTEMMIARGTVHRFSMPSYCLGYFVSLNHSSVLFGLLPRQMIPFRLLLLLDEPLLFPYATMELLKRIYVQVVKSIIAGRYGDYYFRTSNA